MNPGQQHYSLTDHGFQIKNGKRYHNRPLYGRDHMSMVLMGDKPCAMMNLAIHGGKMGNLHIGITTTDGDKWLHDFEDITATYVPGMMRYELKDGLLPGGEIAMEVVSISDTRGFIVKVTGTHLPKETNVVWMFGGASGYGIMVNALWEERYLRFNPSDCVDNDIEVRDGYFWLAGRNTRPIDRLDAIKDPAPGRKTIFGGTSFQGKYKICEASEVESGPAALFAQRMQYSHKTTNIPSVVVFGTEQLTDSFRGYIIISLSDESEIKEMLGNLETVFCDSAKHWHQVAHKVEVKTPDSYLNTVVEAMCVAQDACWYPPSFMHGTRIWMCHYLGWRIYYGPDALGWHERVKTAILAHCARQIKEGPEKGAIPSTLNTTTSPYNMNECFLDQVIYHYQWTGDKALMKEIFQVLKGILIDWEKRVFDPDNDGLYINSLSINKSDNTWYYGGGCTKSSVHMCRANAMLAQIAKDIGEDGQVFQKEAERIKKALFNDLWLPDQGCFAEYKDTVGLKRLHTEPELPTIYHPIEFYLTDDFQSYQMLRWVENSLEVVRCNLPGKDGKLLWSSNWRPTDPDGYLHSSRDPRPNETLNAALAYYRIGSVEKAYDLLTGSVSSCFLTHCPGGIPYKAVGEGFETGIRERREDGCGWGEGVDYSDAISLFCRVIIEGLFGIMPRMQENEIAIMPNFPLDWKDAGLKTEDIELVYQQRNNEEVFEIATPLPRRKQLKAIAKSTVVEGVQVNGKKADYELISGIDHALIFIQVPAEERTNVRINYGRGKYEKINYQPVGVKGEEYRLSTGISRIVLVNDPQGILSNTSLNGNELRAKIAAKCGQHTFFVLLKDKDISYWKPIDIEIRDALEVMEQKFDPSSQTCSYQLRNNLSKDLRLNISSSFLGEEKQEQVQLAAGSTQSFAWKVKNIDPASPGTNLLSIVTKGDKNTEITVPLKCWAILKQLPEQGKHVISRCVPISLTDFYNERIADIFKQEYLSPESFQRDRIQTNGLSPWNSPNPQPDDSLMRLKIKEGQLLTEIGILFQQVKEGKNAAFVSVWDNFPNKIKIPIKKKAHKVYFLICGTTFPMQSHIANGRLIVHYTDGKEEKLDLVNPDNYDDSLADFAYYHYADNACERLGENTHADIVDMVLRADKAIEYIEIEALSNQVVIGLLGITLLCVNLCRASELSKLSRQGAPTSRCQAH